MIDSILDVIGLFNDECISRMEAAKVKAETFPPASSDRIVQLNEASRYNQLGTDLHMVYAKWRRDRG